MCALVCKLVKLTLQLELHSRDTHRNCVGLLTHRQQCCSGPTRSWIIGKRSFQISKLSSTVSPVFDHFRTCVLFQFTVHFRPSYQSHSVIAFLSLYITSNKFAIFKVLNMRFVLRICFFGMLRTQTGGTESWKSEFTNLKFPKLLILNLLII